MLTTPEIKELIAKDNIHKFYIDRAWKRLRKQVLKMDKYECQQCKERGRYTRATHVHHINHVKDRPDLAMSLLYEDNNGVIRRNLISLCKDCHEEQHPHRLNKPKEPITEERW